MTDGQSNLYDMYVVVEKFYLDNQLIIDAVPARATAFTIFQGNVAAINSNIAIQSMVTVGVTTDKKQARITLNDLSTVIFALARTWAISNEDNTNAEEFNFSHSSIARIKDDSIIPFLEHRKEIVDANAAALADYGITPAILTVWENNMTVYSQRKTKPRTAIVTRSLSTSNLGNLFDATQRHLRDVTDPLMLIFKVTNNELYERYIRCRIVIDRNGSGETDPNDLKILGVIKAVITNAPIKDALITATIGDNTVTATSGIAGEYTMPITGITEPTEVDMTVTHPLFLVAARNITLNPGEDNSQDFGLMPGPPPPPMP